LVPSVPVPVPVPAPGVVPVPVPAPVQRVPSASTVPEAAPSQPAGVGVTVCAVAGTAMARKRAAMLSFRFMKASKERLRWFWQSAPDQLEGSMHPEPDMNLNSGMMGSISSKKGRGFRLGLGLASRVGFPQPKGISSVRGRPFCLWKSKAS